MLGVGKVGIGSVVILGGCVARYRVSGNIGRGCG